MIPDESVAYALAAWSRFDAEVSDELLRAVAGAFVLVASADGELDQKEASQFLEAISARANVFEPLDFTALSNRFGDLCAAMFDDPEDGRRLALQCVARMRALPEQARLVQGAAQIAAAADGRVRPPEQAALRAIDAALGLQS
jgi:tellurite resistance protein